MRLAFIFLLALVAPLAGCRTATVATQNLDAVLSSTDSFRYQGDTTTVWRDMFDLGFDTVRGLLSARAGGEDTRLIPNPTEFALANLIRLENSSQGPEAWLDNERVRTFTRYAVYAPSKLCRERATLALMTEAERLGLSEPYSPEQNPANAAELIEAIDGLVDAMRVITERGSDGDGGTARADFEAALAVIEQMELDVQGGARVLRALGAFLRASALPKEFRDSVAKLSEHLQGDLVTEALWSAQREPTPLVRAAAIRAGIEIYGDEFLIEALLSLTPPSALPASIRSAHNRFGLPFAPPTYDLVHTEICRALGESGLPVAAQRRTVEGVELRGALVLSLVSISASTSVYTDRARYAAMDALSALSGGELKTYRFEEWSEWWRQVAPALEAEVKTLQAAAAADDTGSSQP